MKKTSRLKVLLFLILTLILILAIGCENEEAKENPEEDEVVEKSETLGGPLTDFQSLDSEDNTVNESLFEENKVNLIFVWRTG